MESVANKLKKLLPAVVFETGDSLHWSPKNQTITYRSNDFEENVWGLLHEAGHAVLHHQDYHSDIELLQLEVAAWDMAEELGEQTGINIDGDYIQDCLDTYRDWLHQRSTCPRCGIVTFQESITAYKCYNCNKDWSVTASRFCRPYRLGVDTQKNRPENAPQAVFHNSL